MYICKLKAFLIRTEMADCAKNVKPSVNPGNMSLGFLHFWLSQNVFNYRAAIQDIIKDKFMKVSILFHSLLILVVSLVETNTETRSGGHNPKHSHIVFWLELMYSLLEATWHISPSLCR